MSLFGVEISYKKFEERSKYNREMSIRELIRHFLSNLFVNPTSASIILAATSEKLTDLENIVNERMLKILYGKSNKLDLQKNGIYLPPSNFLKSFLRDFSTQTYFLKKILYFSNTYRLSYDGEIIGKTIAFFSILASSDEKIESSTYGIFGPGKRESEFENLITNILLLLYLYKDKDFEKYYPVKEVLKNIFGKYYYRKGEKYIYTKFHRARKRLTKTGLIEYIKRRKLYNINKNTELYKKLLEREKKSEEEISDIIKKEINKEENIKKLEELEASENFIQFFKIYAPIIFNILAKEENKFFTISEIIKEITLNLKNKETHTFTPSFSYFFFQEILRKLEILGYINDYIGSVIRLTEKGRYFLENHLLPLLKLVGMEKLIEEPIYDTLDKEVKPNLIEIYKTYIKIKKELEDERKLWEFRSKCIIARKRYLRERLSI